MAEARAFRSHKDNGFLAHFHNKRANVCNNLCRDDADRASCLTRCSNCVACLDICARNDTLCHNRCNDDTFNFDATDCLARCSDRLDFPCRNRCLDRTPFALSCLRRCRDNDNRCTDDCYDDCP
ncbi:unnamed protein product [Rotaria sordida]|uniref:Uncharacterized protein n=1 Tax=Rotaria sordida TaxID=392033 RepID=A0A814RZT2_9BILA|nr:unnamed protein product [Rotaria sordida]